MGSRRHHRQHHRRPRPRQRPRILIIGRPGTRKFAPLQHRQPPPRLLALPRPNRNPLFPNRHGHRRQEKEQQSHRIRPLPRLALRPPSFRRPGLRGCGQESGHQVARLLQRDGCGGRGGRGHVGDGGDGQVE